MSSVPLAALSIQTQQPPSILDQYSKVAQLKNMGLQQQMGQADLQGKQIENQNAQLQVQDKQGISKALLDSKGDKDAFLKNIQDPQYGVSATGQLGIQQQYQAFKEQGAKTDKAVLDATQEAHTQMTQYLDNVLSAPPEDQAAQYALARNAILRDPTLQKYAQGIPPQFPGPDALKQIDAQMKLSSQLIAEAKQNNEAPGQKAKSEQEQQEAALGPKGRAEIGNEGLQQQNAWLAKNPGKDAADFLKYKASLNPIAQLQAANAAGGGLQQGAIDQAAERYATTGQLPPAARGVAGLAQNRQIMNRAAELHPAGSITANSAEYAANKQSLTNVQKNFDQVSAFENTAGKNLDLFLTTAKKAVDSGSPWINTPLRAVGQQGLGSADLAAFNAARTTAVTEIAKVLNSSNATGVLSDSARGEVQQLIGPNATLKQIYSAANILKQDMANRHQAYQDQIADIKGRLGGGQQHVAGGSSQGLTEGATGTGSDNKKYVVKGGVWVPQ